MDNLPRIEPMTPGLWGEETFMYKFKGHVFVNGYFVAIKASTELILYCFQYATLN